jgi:hypothetical protein
MSTWRTASLREAMSRGQPVSCIPPRRFRHGAQAWSVSTTRVCGLRCLPYISSMPDDPAQPFDGLTRWLSDDASDSPSMPTPPAAHREDSRQPSLRRGARAAMLAAPWVIVVAVLVSPLRTTGSQATGVTGPAQPSPTATGAASPADTASPPGVASPADTASPAGAAPPGVAPPGVTPPAPGSAGATATRLVRDALTGAHAGRVTAVDVAVPEAPRWLGAGQWMVRVHAVVLHGDAQRWRSATHEIWAAPLGMHSGRLVGLDHPWRVATDDARIAPSRWEPAAVDEAAVRSALRTVGAQPAGDLHAEQHPAITDIIRVRVAGGARQRHVWLRIRPTVHVLGAPPAAHAETMPTERATS